MSQSEGRKEQLRRIAKRAHRNFEAFILWLFSKKEMHGYELINLLSEEDSFGKTITAALIYPLLSEMSKKGLLRCRTTRTGRRIRKVYSITSKGMRELGMAKERFRQRSLMREFLKEMLK